MSQRSEKLHRQVEQNRVDIGDIQKSLYSQKNRLDKAAMWASDVDKLRDRVDAVLTSSASMTARYRRRAIAAERRALRLKLIASLLAMASVALLALVIRAGADSLPEDKPPVQAATVTAHCRATAFRRSPTESGTQEEPENELIEAALLASAHRLDDVTVTHYDCCVECCGKADGITASGVRATPGVTVAVDPAVIPLGADVLVDYGDGMLHYYRADDTGSGVVGNHIDLCVADHQTAVQLGRRTATVWWVSA